MRTIRGAMLAVTMACAILSAPGSGSAADGCTMLQGQTVTFVVPFAAGGGYDQYARLLGPHLGRAIGAEVVVTNVGGAGGLIGAKQIRDGAADGKTIGLMSGNSLLIQQVFGAADVPSPTRDFTLLGQLAEESMIWMVANNSPIAGVEALWQRSEPMVAGATGGGTSILLALAAGAELAGIDAEYVGGYRGSRDVTLAMLRGELDVTALGIESSQALVRSGEARPIMVATDQPLPAESGMRDVPVLGGSDGIAAKRAAATGRSVADAVAMASAVAEIIQERRVVVAPAGLPTDVSTCLENGFLEAANAPAFSDELLKAGRVIQVLHRGELVERLGKAEQAATTLAPLAQAAAKRLRS